MCSTCPRCLCPQRAPRIPNTDKALNLNDRGEPWPCPWPPTRRGAGGTLPCEVATVTFWPIFFFWIVGGLYSVTALRKNNDEGVKVYTKHQDLTQASEHHKQMTMS